MRPKRQKDKMLHSTHNNAMLDVRLSLAIGVILSSLIRDRTDFRVWFD